MKKREQARCWPNWNRCGRRCTRSTWPTHHPQESLSLVSVHRLDYTWVRPRAFPKLCQTLVDEHGMEQCRADQCVYRKIVKGVVKLTLVVHVDDIVVSGEKETCEELHHTLNENFPTEILGELKWYLGCAVERDWQGGSVTINLFLLSSPYLRLTSCPIYPVVL